MCFVLFGVTETRRGEELKTPASGGQSCACRNVSFIHIFYEVHKCAGEMRRQGERVCHYWCRSFQISALIFPTLLVLNDMLLLSVPPWNQHSPKDDVFRDEWESYGWIHKKKRAVHYLWSPEPEESSKVLKIRLMRRTRTWTRTHMELQGAFHVIGGAALT